LQSEFLGGGGAAKTFKLLVGIQSTGQDQV